MTQIDNIWNSIFSRYLYFISQIRKKYSLVLGLNGIPTFRKVGLKSVEKKIEVDMLGPGERDLSCFVCFLRLRYTCTKNSHGLAQLTHPFCKT